MGCSLSEVLDRPSNVMHLVLVSRTISGEDLFTLLFEANVVTPTQLAKQFGLSFEELMRVWSEMPMDNAAIAAEMKTTRAVRRSFSWIVVWDFGTKIRPANECV